jgi:hypothetical protein
VSRFAIASYSNKRTGGFGSPHILDHAAIPKYLANIHARKELSRLSKICHEKVDAGIGVTDLEGQIDELAGNL